MRIGAVILAAGSSSRLGQPKQLLTVDGETLLRRAVRIAEQASADPVIVVLGAHAERLRKELAGTTATPVYCERWQDGMGASLAAGVAALPPELDAALILLCDQPRVQTAHLRQLIARAEETAALIVAASYNNGLGAPALFRRALFANLQTIPGDKGARYLIQQHRAQTIAFPLPEAADDVDTPDDLERLNR